MTRAERKAELERRRLVKSAREQRRRYYIKLQYKGPPTYNRRTRSWVYPAGVWPILFRTYDEAVTYMANSPLFANAAALPNRPRIKSGSVESTLLPERP